MSEQAKVQTPGDVAALWWQLLQDQFPNGQPNPRADRAARARLRHADKDSALIDPAFFNLHRRLMDAGLVQSHELSRSLRLALVLAHVRKDEDSVEAAGEQTRRRGFGRAIGAPGFGESDKAALKPLRFRRLLQTKEEDADEIVRQFRRAIDLAGGKVNVRDLANIVFYWNDKARARLAFDYFAAGTAAPAQV
jgi:CRISPR system Cascade subunit CasB